MSDKKYNIFKNIVKYYRNNYPWMYTRNIYILPIITELILFICLLNAQYKTYYDLEIYFIIVYSITIILWVIFSYIINRYKPNYNKYNLKELFLLHAKKSFFLILFFTIIEFISISC